MAANLLVCASQETAAAAYRFKGTNINVYSFEEALYHCFRHWKQSADDLLSDEMTGWVRDALGLSFAAAKMRELAKKERFSDRLLSFLSLTDYIGSGQIAALRGELRTWEKRREWERLKERADDLLQQDDAERAVLLYQKALQFDTNIALLHNLGIALMTLGAHAQAVPYLAQAHQAEPENLMLLMHLAEAHILNGTLNDAQAILTTAELLAQEETADIVYLKGEMQFHAANYLRSAAFYERAAAMRYDSHYIYRLSDVYVKLRQFDKALDTLQAVTEKDKTLLMAQAEIHIQANNVPAAIKCIERALINNRDSIDLWIRLAQYHRLDYDLVRANSAAVKALGLAPDHPKALLEYARIQKAQGRMKDYQSILHQILKQFKDTYRNNDIYLQLG